jgi:hypothetical protein
MSDTVGKDDLKEVRDEIIEEMRDGFRGVFQRQDTTNGRVREGEIRAATHDIRIKHLEQGFEKQRDPFDRRHHDSGVIPEVKAEPKISERDVKLVLGTLGSAGTVLVFFKQILPWIVKALTP